MSSKHFVKGTPVKMSEVDRFNGECKKRAQMLLHEKNNRLTVRFNVDHNKIEVGYESKGDYFESLGDVTNEVIREMIIALTLNGGKIVSEDGVFELALKTRKGGR